MKIYVQETTIKTHDDDRLKVIKTYRSKPENYSYIIWEE